MTTRCQLLSRFLELPRLTDIEARRVAVRQTLATLAQDEALAAPMALAGVDPRALARSVEVATREGCLDDLGFLRAPDAASALHQLSTALPHGPERRALGRRILAFLYEGDAETFATLAARMALGTTKPLEGAGVRARVELCLALGGALEAPTDRLALAVAMRRELARDWISEAATAALRDRRLAGQLLERAAREAARRADSGDRHPLRLFEALAHSDERSATAAPHASGIESAWEALLADRESLVWRHVAVARGLLGRALPALADTTRAQLSADLSPTEWRRGATSLVARIAVDRERALDEALTLLEGPIPKRDPGVAMAMVWGLGPAVDAEPEAAEELLDAMAALVPIAMAESLLKLRRTYPGFGTHAAAQCAEALRTSLSRPEFDDGVLALARQLAHELEGGAPPSNLRHSLDAAMHAYRNRGAREALEQARRALDEATATVGGLTAIEVRYDGSAPSSLSRQRALPLLRELDVELLESHVLGALLLLGRAPGSTASGVDSVDVLHAELASWLTNPSHRDAAPADLDAQATLYQRELRALLHVIDAGHTDFGDDGERRLAVRQRWTGVVGDFAAIVRTQPASRQARVHLATIARALDALVRDGSAEPVDVLLFVAAQLPEPAHVSIIGEASMHPDVTELLAAYLAFVRAPVSGTQQEQARARLASWERFLEVFPRQTTARTEALRVTASLLRSSLAAVATATSMRVLLPETPGADTGALAHIEDAILQLQQLVLGAERRVGDLATRDRAFLPKRHALAQAAIAAVHGPRDDGTAASLESELFYALSMTTRAAEAALPAPIASLVTQTLPLLANVASDRGSLLPSPPSAETAKLPAWVPARRIVGGFYVVRPLGGGNVGSVFVVMRAEERRERDAKRFALKVPEYNATAARTMSEAEFLRFFREEAGALLAIPEHPNVAAFVTFDAGAKPKPILVMELVEGMNCERILGSQGFTMPLALHVLDGVLAGLEAMHGVDIAHLDVKPSNVILRVATGDPVLVDLGLAGRKVRPGCATLCFGAPEIWTTAHEASHLLPAAAADVYAFGCSAYEILTGKTLFDGPSDVSIIAQHLSHDGLPQGLAGLADRPRLVAFLGACLRQSPTSRGSVSQLRAALPEVRRELEGERWPLA